MIAVVPYFTDHHREVLTPHTMGWNCFRRNIQIFIHLNSIHATLSAKIVETLRYGCLWHSISSPFSYKRYGSYFGIKISTSTFCVEIVYNEMGRKYSLWHGQRLFGMTAKQYYRKKVFLTFLFLSLPNSFNGQTHKQRLEIVTQI